MLTVNGVDVYKAGIDSIPKGFWEVSKKFDTPVELIEMSNWLQKKGWKTIFVQNKGEYSLYRNGVESVGLTTSKRRRGIVK